MYSTGSLVFATEKERIMYEHGQASPIEVRDANPIEVREEFG